MGQFELKCLLSDLRVFLCALCVRYLLNLFDAENAVKDAEFAWSFLVTHCWILICLETIMRTKIIYILVVTAFTFASIGCGPSPTANTPANNAANANAANTSSTNPLETKTPTPEQTKNNAPTLTPLFKSFCEAKIKNNEAALRKIYSADTIKNFEEQMKDQKIKSLLKFLEDEKVTAKSCEIRNEEITGDKATAEITYDSYPKGIKVLFVKEAGDWKLTNRSPSFESVKATGANTNAAK